TRADRRRRPRPDGRPRRSARRGGALRRRPKRTRRTKPRLRAFARERPSDLVQLADVGAAVARAAEHVDEGRRPPVVTGKVHEIFRRLRHRLLPLAQSQAGARPAGLAILPSGRLSAAIRFISSSVSAKSKTLRFSAMRLGFDERGIGTMLPCWISQRSAI